MKAKYSSRFWDVIFQSREYEKLAELSGLLCSAAQFNQSDLDYGLPKPAFMFVEGLLWFAQAQRSGAWTYFEATPQPRQFAQLAALQGCAPPEFATHYRSGMRNWKDRNKVATVDQWIRDHDKENNAWLWSVANENRPLFESIGG